MIGVDSELRKIPYSDPRLFIYFSPQLYDVQSTNVENISIHFKYINVHAPELGVGTNQQY